MKWFEISHLSDILSGLGEGERYSMAAPDQVERRLQLLNGSDSARVSQIGLSREGRPIWGLVIGRDQLPTIALTGNCHAEEVIGTISILHLAENLVYGGSLAWLLDHFRFVMIPQMNPDGTMRHLGWLENPSPANYFRWYCRDSRNHDVEHGIAVGEIPFQRPEPQALVDFYSREAGDRCVLYLTLHSSRVEPGAYFLTGNEDLGVMEAGFNLIRELAPRIGMPLKTEDTRGYHMFRRISDGVYNVPRHAEMSRDFTEAGMKTAGFLLNSLEFMERRGTKICLVSEIPTLQSPTCTEMPLNVPALALFAPRIPIMERSIAEQRILLDRMSDGDLASHVANPDMLAYHREFFSSISEREAAAEGNYFSCFFQRPALQFHETILAGLPYKQDVKLAAMALRILDAETRPEWEKKFLEAFAKLNGVYRFSSTPIAAQIRLHALLMLSGIKVVLDA